MRTVRTTFHPCSQLLEDCNGTAVLALLNLLDFLSSTGFDCVTAVCYAAQTGREKESAAAEYVCTNIQKVQTYTYLESTKAELMFSAASITATGANGGNLTGRLTAPIPNHLCRSMSVICPLTTDTTATAANATMTAIAATATTASAATAVSIHGGVSHVRITWVS